ncbi:MAG: protein kinase [Gemmataceae bacterium]|nr:protein kinase [Gemmataceae bacterium]
MTDSTPSLSVPDPAHQLWDLWQLGLCPDVQEFVRRAGTLRPVELVAVLRVDQRERWQRGERPPAEAYLHFHAADRVHEAFIDLIYGEFLLREERGEQPCAEEYLQRFPQFRTQLLRQLSLHEALEADPSGTGSGTGTNAESVWTSLPPLSQHVLPTFPVRGGAAVHLPDLAGYEILDELGRGGMGVVYKARQVALQRIVALKMIPAQAGTDPEQRARFRTEAEAAARLQHLNIVQIYEVGEQEGRPYLCLEYVDGGSLAQRLAGTPIVARVAAELTLALARAVHHAHLHGVVHRDLKPANVLLASTGREPPESPSLEGSRPPLALGIPKIGDFGLAKQLDADSGLTRSGTLLGTPSYMAPEQTLGRPEDVGTGADVYALGATLFEMLTGHPPFRAATAMDTLALVRTQDPVPPRRLQPKVPRDLETVCLKCLEKKPGRRYASAAALADDLKRFLAGEPVQARPAGRAERLLKWARRKPAVAALVVVSVFAAAALLTIGTLSYAALSDSAAREKDRADALDKANERNTEQLLETRRNYYAANIQRTQQAWHDLRAPHMVELLSELRPHGPDDPDLRGFEWHYLWRLAQKGLFRTPPARQLVSSMAFSPDGTRLATATAFEGTVQTWETATGKLTGGVSMPGHTYHAIAYSSDGRRLLTLGLNGSWQLWDLGKPGKPLLTYQRKNLGETWAVFSPDSKLVAGHDSEDGVFIWDAATGQRLTAFRGHGQPVQHLAFSPDGRLLAAATAYRPAPAPPAGADKAGEVILWDVAARKEVGTLRGHADGVTRVAFGADGSWLVSASRDHTVKVWDPATEKELFTYRGHTAPIEQLLLGPDPLRRCVASASRDRVLRIWNFSGRDLLTLANVPSSARPDRWLPLGLAFRPDGRQVAVSGPEGTVSIYDLTTGREAAHARLPSPPNVNTGQPALVSQVAFSPDGARLAAACVDRSVFLWEAGTGIPAFRGRRLDESTSACATSGDGRHVAIGRRDGTMGLYAADDMRERRPFAGHAARVRCLAFSPDGTRLASADEDLLVKVWDVTDGRELHAFRGHELWAERLLFSPDGRWLASAAGRNYGTQGETRLWDLTTGRLAHALPGQDEKQPLQRGQDHGLAFHADSRVLATASQDGVVRLWEVATAREVSAFRGHGDPVLGVTFSPDGGRLASGGRDQTVKVWDVASRREQYTLRGHTDHVFAVAFSPDGGRIASGGRDRTVRLWHCDTRRELLALRGHVQSVFHMAFLPGGHRLLSNGEWGVRIDMRVGIHPRVGLDPNIVFDPSQGFDPGANGDPRIWDGMPLDGS